MTPHPPSLIPHSFHECGFTLVELLVVLGILGILIGVLLATFAGTGESARATKCLSNMRNLALAWHGGAAGSQEMLDMEAKNTSVRCKYEEKKGWISSATKGLYPSESKQTFQPIGFLEADREIREYAITNGWMYGAIGHNTETYTCPSHRHKREGQGRSAWHWNYFMNSRFGWDEPGKAHTKIGGGGGVFTRVSMDGADRTLLFAEIPHQGPGDWFPTGESGTTDSDAVLWSGKENIGGNHRSAKKWHAHVAFADGHVEKLNVDGLSGENMKELTTWLCEGKAVGRTSGGKYEELK